MEIGSDDILEIKRGKYPLYWDLEFSSIDSICEICVISKYLVFVPTMCQALFYARNASTSKLLH